MTLTDHTFAPFLPVYEIERQLKINIILQATGQLSTNDRHGSGNSLLNKISIHLISYLQEAYFFNPTGRQKDEKNQV